VPVPALRPARLEEAIALLRRRHGAQVVRRGDGPLPGAAWATGIPALDALSGIGGLPCGRVSVLAAAGPGATGRLTLLQALLAGASRRGTAAYLDLAGTLDPGFLADLGADLDACLVLRPPRGGVATGLAMARALVRAGVPWLGVALGRRCPSGAALDQATAALAATAEGSRSVVCVSAAAPMPAALAYASSLTLACSPAGWQQSWGDVAGLRLRVAVTKSKLGAPGAATGLLLHYPRPWAAAEVVALPALVEGIPGDQGLAAAALPAVAAAW